MRYTNIILLLMAALVLPGVPGQAIAAGAPSAAAQQATPSIREISIGTSVNGQPISGIRIGDGPRKFVLAGNTHGGPEANTYRLVTRLAEYFRSNPGEVPPSVRLYILPTINPDGLALGSRFNAHSVDLNRNMNTDLDSCPDNDWSNSVQGARGIESNTGGPYPDSEPESRAIRDFLIDASGVIFFHSDGGDVFPASCEHAPSIALAQLYASATGYRYDRYWRNYMITGGMHDWAGSIGIAAITPELFTGEDDDYAQNLAGVQAVLGQAEQLLPLPADHQEAQIGVPALIWRYWKAHGGSATFGEPLAPAETAPDGVVRQYFARALLEIHPDKADTPQLVQLAALGQAALAGRAAPPAQDEPGVRFFGDTQHTLREAFLEYWDRNDGALLFGSPISEEFATTTADGKQHIVQYFERALFSYDDQAGVQLEPLGWSALVQERLRGSLQPQQIR